MEKEMEVTPMAENEFELLFKVSTSLHAILDLDDMLKHILNQIKRTFMIEGTSIALHDAEKKEFYFIRTLEEAKSPGKKQQESMRFPDNVGVAGWVIRENKTALIPDTSKDDRFYDGMDRQQNFVTRSMVCVPLRTRKGLIGVLYALNKIDKSFTAKEGRLLEILSGTVAIAIENAQLYGELKQYANSLEQENRRLLSQVQDRYNLQGVIGSSRPMCEVFSLVDKVVNSTTSVLLQGETGTGKELFARVIHYDGPRKNKPFVVENCAAIPETLLESELFGHVKGAFTNAISDKKGLFELADGGTVFLDEIGETSPAMQVKLLRVLQEGQIRRVGGTRLIDINVRLIASTNRNLEKEVEKGIFREDLFYRISVFPIRLPPLREIRSDIPLLAEHFLKKFGKKLNRPEVRILPQALQLLIRFHWPGNVREFENEIERAITMTGGGKEISPEHLSEKIKTDSCIQLSLNSTHGTLHEVINQIERQMVMETLSQTRGNRSQAAKQLGLTRQGLLNKIKRYKLNV